MLVEVPPPAPDIKELEKLVENRADRFSGLGRVFIKAGWAATRRRSAILRSPSPA